MRSSTPLAAGAVLASALLLAACSGDGGGAGGETVTQAVTSEGGPAPADDTATAQDDTTSADAVDPQAQEDPVFAAIDAALDAYPGASVVDVDRDDGETFDIDLVVGDEQVELEISADGAARGPRVRGRCHPAGPRPASGRGAGRARTRRGRRGPALGDRPRRLAARRPGRAGAPRDVERPSGRSRVSARVSGRARDPRAG